MGGKERRESKDEDEDSHPLCIDGCLDTRAQGRPPTGVLRGVNTLLNGVGYLLPYSATVKSVEERPTSGNAPAVADIGKA